MTETQNVNYKLIEFSEVLKQALFVYCFFKNLTLLSRAKKIIEIHQLRQDLKYISL